jgi:hypothetical protein
MSNARYGGIEGANAALVLALGVGIMALTASGGGPLTPRRLLSAVLSNPIPRRDHIQRAASVGFRGVRTAPQAAHRQTAAA